MAKKTTDQILTTVSTLAKQLGNEAEKDDKVSLIIFYSLKASQSGQSYINASAATAFSAIMNLAAVCGCGKEEVAAIAGEIEKGMAKKFGPPNAMSVVTEEANETSGATPAV